MKTIVTHFNPDLDAISATWLVKKFMPGFSEAEVTFVPAGKTLDNQNPDADPDIIHVDTGYGKFDHHQTSDHTSATARVFEYLLDRRYIKKKHGIALGRLVNVVTDIDHFGQVAWPDPANDRYDFSVDSVIDGWRLMYPRESTKVMELGFIVLEAVLKQFENKQWAEEVIREEGETFKSSWGKSLGVESTNDEVVHLAQKLGYGLVVRKDPRKGYVRIKASPLGKKKLAGLYKILVDKDPQATWFLHASGKMILNGSTKSPDMKPSKLKLEEIMSFIKSFK